MVSGQGTISSADPHGEAGFSLIEVMVALAIFLSALVATSSLLATGLKVGSSSRLEQVATDIATSQLDADVLSGATALLGEPGYSSVGTIQRGGVTYSVERGVFPGQGACAAPALGVPNELTVAEWVTWTKLAAGRTWWTGSTATTKLVEESTYAAIPAAALSSTLGAILVTVTDDSGAGQGLATVSITGPSPSLTKQQVTTSSAGCALFSNLAVGAYATVASLGGWIDTTESLNNSTAQTAVVTAGAAATLPIKFAPAATIGSQYSITPVSGVVGTWNLPTWSTPMPISLYNSTLANNPFVALPGASVYPFGSTPSYTAVAGSCGTDSIPDGSATDGVPVNLTDGSSATASFSLMPIELVVTNAGTPLAGATVTATASTLTGATDSNCPTSGSSTAMPAMSLGTTCASGSTCATSSAYDQSTAVQQATLASWTIHVATPPRTGGSENPGYIDAILTSLCLSKCSTTTTLSSSANPSVVGQPVTLTATVTSTGGTPSVGTVTFKNGATTLCSTVAVILGAATCTVSTLPPASNTISASYRGSGIFKSRNASNLTQVVNKAASTITLVSSANPTAAQTTVVLTAAVAAASPGSGTPTGTVTFMNGATTLGTGTMTAGVATFTTAALAPGSYSLTAVYGGDSNFTSSTSSTLNQQVTAAATYVLSGLPYGMFLISASYNNTALGQHFVSAHSSVVVVVKVTAAGLTIYNNGVQLGSLITPSSFGQVFIPVQT
ncbi:MAG TPA: Ig-like domain repeat protein [Acidimicrobiales bacterium]|nr:Ig-like domain repeat protein [Acidimicrobiales bacterium]